MTSNRVVTALLLIAALVVVASPVGAQYMYLDSNGNGVHDSGDRLATNGTPTTVDVWMTTNRNRDGSLATCNIDPSLLLGINSYVFNLSATSGFVSYSGFVNHISNVAFGELNPGDGVRYKNGFGGQTTFPPGSYLLATLTITGQSGSPAVSIVDMVSGSTDFTSFGTGAGGCFGNDFDNTYKLTGPNGGTDWTDADGLGPAFIDEGTPILNAIGNKTVNEGDCLTFTATATPAHGGALTFTLDPGAPAGASITQDGQFIWCPTEAQGPGVYPVTVRVTEDGTPVGTDAETIGVTVLEVNQAPVLAPIGNKTVMAGNTLSFTATATDADLPANALSFSLDPGSPVFPGITTGGNFSWEVQANQAPGDYPVTVRVTDNGIPALSDAKTFTVTVLLHEESPVVTNPGNKTVTTGSCLNLTVTATGGQGTLTFSLGAGAPSGASITPSGQFNWCPSDDQPGTYSITVNVSDGSGGTGSTSFSVFVAPASGVFLRPIGDKTVNEGVVLLFEATAITSDGSMATFSLSGSVPPGASLGSPGGLFTWMPTEAQGGAVYPVTICASAGGGTDCETINITVNEVNLAPVLSPIGNKTAVIGVPIAFTATATDADLPANTLTFSLDPGSPVGATIDASTGAFTWNPFTLGTFPVTIRVTDDGSPPLSDFETILIVLGQPGAPVLTQPANMTVDEGAIASQTLTGTDPGNAALTFTKTSGPPWMTVTTTGSSTGRIDLAPDFAAAGSYVGTVRASNGTLVDEKSFTIVVTNICRPPLADAGGPYVGTTGRAVSFSGSGSADPDGDALTYAWSFGDGDTGSGVTPSHVYPAAGTYTVSLDVSDGCGSDRDVTTASISDCLTAFFFATGNKKVMINLQAGKSTDCLQVEPVLGAFRPEDVDLASVVMRSPNTGSISEIHAVGDKSSVGADRNGNGIDEITACFAKSDLRLLFSSLTATQTVEVTLEGNLLSGGRFCTTQGLSVKAAGAGNLVASISPNPLNPSAVLTFATQERGSVLVQLFDVHGRLVRTLRDEGDAAAGYHDVRIDGVDANGAKLSSGVYFVRIRAGADEERKAITILK